MKKTIYLLSLLALITFASCQKEDHDQVVVNYTPQQTAVMDFFFAGSATFTSGLNTMKFTERFFTPSIYADVPRSLSTLFSIGGIVEISVGQSIPTDYYYSVGILGTSLMTFLSEGSFTEELYDFAQVDENTFTLQQYTYLTYQNSWGKEESERKDIGELQTWVRQ